MREKARLVLRRVSSAAVAMSVAYCDSFSRLQPGDQLIL